MTSGGNKFNDFPENQLTKKRIKTTNPFFYNTVHRQTATKQLLLAEVTNTVCLLQEHQGENTEKDGLVCLQIQDKVTTWDTGYALALCTRSFMARCNNCTLKGLK